MGSIPVIDIELNQQMLEFCKKCLTCLGSMSSAFHIEVFREKSTGELVFLEAAARTPGALVPEMCEIIYGANLELMHYQTQMDNDVNFGDIQKKLYAGWITYPKLYGEVKDIVYPDITLQHQFMSFVHINEHLDSAETLLDSACSVVFWSDNYDELKVTFERLKKFSPLIISKR